MGRRSPRGTLFVVLGAALVVVATACDTGDGRTLDPPTQPLPAPSLAEPAPPTEPPVPTQQPVPTETALLQLIAPWRDGAEIPVRYTCDGEDVSPALTWTNVPAGTIELAVTVTDLDAGGFVHWILYAIPSTQGGLAEREVPAGVLAWANSYGNQGWDGPCPPVGENHRYQFTVHALNQQVEAADNATAAEVISILNLIAIDQSSVSGTFVRTG